MGNAGRVLMIPKGDYNAATTYEMLDFVYYQGRSYVCKQTSTGNVPTNTTYWQALTGDASAEIQALTNQLTDETKARAALGAHNILDVNLDKIKSWNTTGTWSDNTYTVQGMTFDFEVDGKNNVTKITANRAQVGAGNIFLPIASFVSENYNLIPNTEYIISGCPSGGSVNSYMLYATNGGSTLNDTRDTGNGAKFTAPTLSSNFVIYIMVLSAVTMTNKEFYPMIRLAADTDPTYHPYAKTNLELTADVAEITSGSYLVKRGKLVQLAVNTWTAKSSITIPANFRPRKQMIFVIEQRKESAPTEIVFNRLTVGTDGTIMLLGENDQLLGTVYWFTA